MDQTMQLGKNAKGFLIEQKRAAFLVTGVVLD